MADILPPAPIEAQFGAYNWVDWYKKVRDAINDSATIAWSQITDFTGSNLTSIATRLHSSLQSLQGGSAGEYYHLTSAQHTDLTDAGDSALHFHSTDRARANHTGTQLMSTISDLPTLASGTYTPTLTNVTNLDASTAYECQYLRVGSVVTVSGKVDIDPTAAAATELGISLPIASNIGAQEDCAGTAAASAIAGQCAAIQGDAANNRAALVYISSDVTNQPMYFTFTYQII